LDGGEGRDARIKIGLAARHAVSHVTPIYRRQIAGSVFER
jgi:hypothetical protein